MTKKFGIIGNPIKHSLSPVLHNYWFKKYKIDANYSIIDIKDSELPNIIDKIKSKDLKGINVTLPYKQKIVSHIDLLINDAQRTSSVNTVYFDDKDKKVIGENTDVFGLQAAYLKEVDGAHRKKALIIGAGGVSPSVILSLKKSDLRSISITNRTMEKCFFKKKFNNLKIVEWKDLHQEVKNYDIIINATSLGLKNGEEFDFDFKDVKKDLIFIDTIYNPLETKTLKYLREKDAKVFNGLDMFIYQGQKAFYLWNKINPEIDQKLIDVLKSKLKS